MVDLAPDPLKALEAAGKSLAVAQESFDRCYAAYKTADRDHIAAKNRLNDAQKAFDAAVEAVRAKAPYDSAWYNKKAGHP